MENGANANGPLRPAQQPPRDGPSGPAGPRADHAANVAGRRLTVTPGFLRACGRALIGAGGKLGLAFYFTIRQGVGAGLKINLDRASANYARGTNELPVQQVLQERLHPGAVFFDIGSNVGFFALIAARLVGARGKVFAFEPIARNAKRIRENAARNRFGNIRVLEIAAGRTSGTVEMFVTRHPGGGTLANLPDTGRPLDTIETIRVDMASIDGLIASGTLPPPTLVKIDVEGAELLVLQGMTRTLQNVRPAVLFEVDAPEAEALAAKYQAVADFLTSHRYRLQPLEDAYAHASWAVRHALALPIPDEVAAGM